MSRLVSIKSLCVIFLSPFVCYASEQGNEDVQRGDLAPHLWAMQVLRKNGLKNENAGYLEPIPSNYRLMLKGEWLDNEDAERLKPIESNSPRYEPSVDSPRSTREDPVLNRRSGSKNIQPPQLVPKEEDANKE